MKTINFELSKILTKLGLLDNIETEYFYSANGLYQNWRGGNRDGVEYGGIKYKLYDNEKIKTLTTEEAIEFLKNEIGVACDFSISNRHNIDWYISGNFESTEPNLFFEGKTLIEAIEQMIEFLIDNNLLTNK